MTGRFRTPRRSGPDRRGHDRPGRKEGLEIRYASLNLAAPDKGRFKYQLGGYETTPKERPGNDRKAFYSKLPPGEYQFQVTACNEDDVWNPAGATLALPCCRRSGRRGGSWA